MVTHAIASALSQPVQVTTVSQRGAVSPTFTDITRVNYSALPAGAGGYSVIAFGHVGRFVSTGGTDKFALIGLRFLNGGNPETGTISRVPLHSPLLADAGSGDYRNSAHPWCAVLNVPSWPTNTALAISATIEQVSAPSGNPGSFWVDVSTILVFSHSSTGLVYQQNTTTATLPYSDVGYHTLTTTPTIPTAGRWIAFYSAQATTPMRPLVINPLHPYHCWLSKRISGAEDTTFGTLNFAQVTGCSSRLPNLNENGPLAPLVQLYSLGGWYPVDVATGSTVDLQVRGFTASPLVSGYTRAESYHGAVFVVPESVFTDLVSEAEDVVPGLLNRDPWTTAQTRVVEIGDDRPQHITIAMSTLHDTVEALNKQSFTLLDVGGFPQQRFPLTALQTRVDDPGLDYLPNYASQILGTAPFLAQYPELPVTLRGILNPWRTASADSGGSFALLSITPTDAGDRPPVVQRTITYVPITLDGEIDGTTLAQLTDDEMPSGAQQIARETGLVRFTTDDGHTITWPTWSRSRRAWRVQWVCSQARYQTLYAKLYRPDAAVFVTMPPSWPDAPGAVVRVDQLAAEQVGSNLVWRITATLIETVYTP